MQAVILVGGEGTRLRPITSTVPKPVVPLVDRPLMGYMLEWLKGHGVEDVVMLMGYLATALRNVLGDGSAYGLRIRYVEDPSAYGLVRLDEDRAVREFVEKPSPDAIDTNLISAGAYVLERDVVDLIEPDRNVSIEREIWPQLVGAGLFAYPHEAYWADIGTPERYLQSTFDILEGLCKTRVAE